MTSVVSMKRSLQVAAVLTACLFSLSVAQRCNSATQIGIADENIIPSDNIITSSEKVDHEKDKIRFDCCQGTYGQAWCPADGDVNPFVEIHLANPVAIGQIKIQPPTTLASPANYFYPNKFMKTFDLFIKLEGFDNLLRVAEDITAIPNMTVTMAELSLNPSLQTDIIRIEPNQYEKEPCFRMELYQCDVASMCPTNFCQNGGVCAGENTCDCTSTSHYGEMCQYTRTQIPMKFYTFLQIVNQLLITTAHNFTFQGQVSLVNSGGLKYLLIPPKSIVDLTGTDITSCLSHIDSCYSGFTIRVDLSFSNVVTTETQIVLTTGAVFEAGVNGILFYFNAGRVFCYVLTSSRAWHVVKTFTLVENKWYEMIITWSQSTGLVLLEGSNVLGSSFMPSAVNAPISKPLTIGYSVFTTFAELRVKSLTIIPLFWSQLARAGISLEITTTPAATTTTTVPTTPWVPEITTTPAATTTTPVPTTPWVPDDSTGSITIQPSTIELGMTSNLDIFCTFSMKDHPGVVGITSLILSRANSSNKNFIELAAVTQFTPDTVSLLTQEVVTSSGVLSQTGDSFLHLRWQNPTAIQAGVYQCSANSVDFLGHNTPVVNTAEVTVQDTDLNYVLQRLTQLENRVTDLESTVSDLKAWKQHMILGTFDALGSYGNSAYYLSKEELGTVDHAVNVCTLFGGQLVVIDDKNEYDAIISFIHVDNSYWIAISGTDAASEGQWVVQSTNKSLPFVEWGSYQPNQGASANCLVLYDDSGSWKMGDDLCHFDPASHNTLFMCEMPQLLM